MKYTEFSPPPWRWKRGEGDMNDALLDGKGLEICDFGDTQQYYPSAGSEPTLGDSILIEIAREMYDLLRESDKAEDLEALIVWAKVRAGICPLCGEPIIDLMDAGFNPSQVDGCFVFNSGTIQCGRKEKALACGFRRRVNNPKEGP